MDIVQLVIVLAGGLALFLFGMEQLTDALKLVAGGRMKGLLSRLTANRFYAATVGAVVTAIIQSSSVTTVLVVGFVSAGLMSLSQSVGIIMGANVGTTVTAQIIAFKVSQYGLAAVAAGFAMLFLSKRRVLREYGNMLMGLGLVFFGMELMSQATDPLRTYEPFVRALQRMETPLLGILVSAGFTALIQSSSATTALIIVLAQQGLISLEAGIALVFGANIGTCVTALLAAIGKPVEAKRVAWVHVLFNVVGVLVWLGFIEQLAEMVRWLSPSDVALSGMELRAADTPRQVANAHTLFNVANTVLLISFAGPMAWLASRIVRDRPGTGSVVDVKYLDDLLIDTPDLALDRVRMETRRISDRAHDMVAGALKAALHGSDEDLDRIAKRDEEIDALHADIVAYLGRLSQGSIGHRHARRLGMYLSAANYIENLADMVETNIVSAGRERVRFGLRVSRKTEQALGELHAEVARTARLAFESVDSGSLEMAEAVIQAKSTVNRLAEGAEARVAARLAATDQDRVAIYRIETEIIEYLKRVYYFAKRIAKLVLDQMEERDDRDERRSGVEDAEPEA